MAKAHVAFWQGELKKIKGVWIFTIFCKRVFDVT
jgi:hypothetical protein